jgi:glycerol-3-phosphate acyltransferase PlsY
LTLLGDLGKGYLAVWFSRHLSMEESWVWLTGISVVLGHIYPVTLGFKGGKGVATGLGVLYGIQPLLGWLTVIIWGSTVWWWRYSTLGAIVAFGLLPLWVLWLRPVPEALVFSMILTLLILIKHRSNIQRLRSGAEPKIGRS